MTVDSVTHRNWSHALLSVVLLCLTALTLGCNERAATVYGSVTLNGEPLTQGMVTFHPQGAGRPGYGPIAVDGSYSIHTSDGDGIAPGRYEVTVVALQPPTPAADPYGMPSPGESITPRRYASAQTSDLTADVRAGANRLDFSLSGE